jgi:hypothetical protein
MGIKVHNKGPNRIKKLESFEVFKVQLQYFILHHSLYTVNQFL